MAVVFDHTLRLPATEHFPRAERKTGIAIHHTVGGSAASTLNWWRTDRQMVGTAYLIERNGTVHEVFDPAAWAWQFGLPWAPAKKARFEKRFVGIEIASEGGLREVGGKLYCFDRVSARTEKPRDGAFDFGRDYRGYRWFDRYEPAQVDALCGLIDHLCDRFSIPRRAPDRFIDFYGEALDDFEGIIGHAMVRMDKTDPLPDVSFWERILRDCGVSAVHVGPDARTGDAVTRVAGPLDERQIEELFAANVQQINRMNVSAGSMVKGLLMELERTGRKTFLRLSNPVVDGHAVDYELVQGDRDLVGRIGRALGFRQVTDTRLEVRSA
jgi:hypothetical protein